MSQHFANARVLTDGVMTGTTVLTTAPSCINQLDNCSYTMVWTSTAVGAFTFEVSNNYENRNGTESGTWTVLTIAAPPTNPAGSASNTGVDLSGLPYRHVRCKYTNSSSTGVLNVFFNGKGL
jgi:hypothetical protein